MMHVRCTYDTLAICMMHKRCTYDTLHISYTSGAHMIHYLHDAQYTLYMMHVRCTYDTLFTWCTQGAHMIHSIYDARKVHIWYTIYMMYTRCTHDTFQIHYGYTVDTLHKRWTQYALTLPKIHYVICNPSLFCILRPIPVSISSLRN